MAITRWDPFRELEEMSSRLNRLFRQGAGGQPGTDGSEALADWAPAIDIQETDGEYLVHADLPAVKKEDVKVSVQDGILAVEGERKHEKDEKGKRFHRVERSFGRFVRRITLPISRRWRPSTRMASSSCICRSRRRPSRARSTLP